MKKSPRGLTPVIRLCSLFQSRVHAGTFIHRGYINDGNLDTKMEQMYPPLPYLDIQVIQGQRNLGVGYIFLLFHNLYLKKENKVLEEDAYNTKIISLKKSTRERSFVLRVCSLFQGRVEPGTFYFLWIHSSISS